MASNGCATLCHAKCSTICEGYCLNTCSGTCSGGCSNSCTGGCATGCTGGCYKGCSSCTGSCTGGCTANCQDGCDSGCTGTCYTGCTGDCYGTCKTTCTANCQDDCSTGCTGSCYTGCSSTCKGTCRDTCQGSCTGQTTTHTITYYDSDGTTILKTETISFATDTYNYYIYCLTPAHEHYNFDGWVGSDSGHYNQGAYVTINWNDGNWTFTAHYTPMTTATLVVHNQSADGSIYVQDLHHPSTQGTSITIDMTEYGEARYQFIQNSMTEGYELDRLEDSNGNQLSVNQQYLKSIGGTYDFYAYFKKKQCTVTIDIVVGPDGQTGHPTGAGTYDYGNRISVAAWPNIDSATLYWTRNGEVVSRLDDYTFDVVNAQEQMEIHYTVKLIPITLVASPSAGGTVSGGGNVRWGHSTTITATPNTGWRFLGWYKDGERITTASSYTFVVKDAQEGTYTAMFTNKDFTLEVIARPKEGGTAEGSGNYNYNTAADLYARANDGWVFTGWSNGKKYPYQYLVITELTPTPIYANFSRGTKSYNIDTEVYPDDHAGSITGDGRYKQGTYAYIEAYPSELHRFVEWENQGSTSNPLIFTVTQNENIIGVFERWPNIFVGDNRVKTIYLGDTELERVSLGGENIYKK